MTKLEKQIRELSPSVKDALYRRLMFAEDLAWLRDENKKDYVIGFEVDLEEQELSGFTLIAIQRHTIIAFVSDRNENPRLILFPALETLFDPGFELLDLIVTRKEFKDSTFAGIITGQGRFGDMVKDLTPPNRKVDISNTVLDQIAHIIETEEETKKDQSTTMTHKTTMSNTPISESKMPPAQENVYAEEPEYEEGPPDDFVDDEPNNFDDYVENDYDEYEDYNDYEEQKISPSQNRIELLKSQKFSSLNDVIDFAVTKLGVNRPLSVTLANKAMQSIVSPEHRVELAVKIFCKLIEENKI